MKIAALNGLEILACDIQNAYLTVKCRELIWTTAGPELRLEEGSIMVIKISIYGLKSSGAEFRDKLLILLHNIGYTPSKADPDLWMRPAIKSDGTEYYECALVYVDSVLVIRCVLIKTIEGIKCLFKLKGYKVEPPNMYLGESIYQFKTKGRTKCWSVSAKKYIKADIVNLEATLAKRDM